MKQKWTVEFEIDTDNLELDNSLHDGITTVEDYGITHWFYQSPTTLLEWRVLKKQELKT